jgi:hypothetical protein
MHPLQNNQHCDERASHEPARRQRIEFGLSVTDLRDWAELVPRSALDLVRAIGADAAVALMRGFGGAQLVVPKHADHNRAGAIRWWQLAEIVGEAAMPGLTAYYGGSLLDVPRCAQILAAKRDAWVRDRFDKLTGSLGAALSARDAVLSIGLDLAGAGSPLTYRAIERIIN